MEPSSDPRMPLPPEKPTGYGKIALLFGAVILVSVLAVRVCTPPDRDALIGPPLDTPKADTIVVPKP